MMRFRRSLLFVEANLFVSGRFFYLWSELDDLSALFRGPPFHAFLEVGRYVELDCFCHISPAFSPHDSRMLFTGLQPGSRFVWPCHTHPHRQGTESLNLSFFIRALQIADDLTHIDALQSSKSPTKAAFGRMSIGLVQVEFGCGAVVSRLLNDCSAAQA